ncbi:TauD/TfdA family dioxygenase [Allopusillimonas soli]|uniref:TauD/TfdA family dioxygenase n=1 Tax=Allopusillimonas soli TaxID=659016 RepID=A0A853FHB0_9BURK|nr:TauD/TfdA family dioxygenase [Allopusillimonas soli]NYT38180.1 TauD/TfdA family dioxygenase [Allopusillimonas soli]TEA74052.1 TauD/TfdA family dioxygenase [Allopusillimonas soli]
MNQTSSAIADRQRDIDVEVLPLAAALGAEVKGVNVAEGVGDDQMAVVLDALHTYGVIVLRDQRLTPQQQVAFCRRLGPMRVSFMTDVAVPEAPELTIVSNIVKDGRPIGLVDAGALWHTDGSYLPQPDMYTVLHAIQIPQRDGTSLGETRFMSTAAVYENLPDDIREKIDSAQGVHSLSYHIQRKIEGNFKAPPAKDSKPDVLHPAVIQHPVTKRKGIYLTEGHTKAIQGLPEQEGRELLDVIATFAKQPQFLYRHKWREGDLLVWDNVGTQHLAITDYGTMPRRLHRAGISSPFDVFTKH